MMRKMLLATFLLAAAPALAAEPGNLFGAPGGESEIPHRFIKVDALDYGLYVGDPFPALTFRVATVTCVLNRWRFGAAATDAYVSPDYWDAGMLLPIHVGFTLWSNPKATGSIWGAVPDVYVEMSGSLWQSEDVLYPEFHLAPCARAALCCDVDYYGFGARLESGILMIRTSAYGRVNALYAQLQFRGLAFGIGF